jgi:hypothetical protein
MQGELLEMTPADWLLWTAVASNLATASSVAIALVVYLRERRRHIESRALDRFLAVNEQYRDYLKMFVDHPELHEKVPYAPKSAGKSLEERQRGALFEIKVCELESAYFLYIKQRTEFERAQWQGWHEYMKDWLSEPTFRKAWEGGLGDEYDQDFKEYMDALLSQLKAKEVKRLQDQGVDPEASKREAETSRQAPNQRLERTGG